MLHNSSAPSNLLNLMDGSIQAARPRVWQKDMVSFKVEWAVGEGWEVKREQRTSAEWCKGMFICPCYPSEVVKGGERGAPFVPQEPADGCNPFQNAHWKSIKTGWTWCMRAEAGDTFSGRGSQRNTSWVKPASLVLSRQKKYCKERQREWIAIPFNEVPLDTPQFVLNTAAISSLNPAADTICRGYKHKNLQTLTSYSNKAT